MKPPRIEIIKDESYQPPEGALGLGQDGWQPGVAERLSIYTTNDLNSILNRILTEYKGLLGEGELVFATTSTEGRPDHDPNGIPCMAYQGYVVFFPESEPQATSMRRIELPEGTPKHIADFLLEHWEDFRRLGKASDPDCVLVAWTGQRHFSVQAVPRTKILEEEPESVPAEAKEGPIKADPAAEFACWASICTPTGNGDEFQVAWCSLNFYPEIQA